MSYHSSHEKKAPLSLSEIFIRVEKQKQLTETRLALPVLEP